MPLWPKQIEFVCHLGPCKGFVGGRGSGKSRVGAYDLLKRAKAGRLYCVTAPTYKVLRDATVRTFHEVARICRALRQPVRGEAFSARIHTADKGEAEILFRSTEDPELLRGPNLSGVWMDEASLSKQEAHRILTACLREAGESGWLTGTFTPKGRTHWTYEVFSKAFLVQARTDENPFLPAGFLEQVQGAYAGLEARQELGGEFVQVEGAEWPEDYFPDSIWFDDWPRCQIKTMALDPSKGKSDKAGDYAAWVLLGRDAEGGLWCEADMIRGQPAEGVVDAGVTHAREFMPDLLGIEGNQWLELFAVLFRQACARDNVTVPVRVYNNLAPKVVRIRRLGPLLARQMIRFRNTPGTKLLVGQLMDFPEAEHDDGPDALEMALRAMVELQKGRQR